MGRVNESKASHRNSFSESERNALLGLSGVGPSVIQRLEEIGISNFRQLREFDAKDITVEIARQMGSTCWRNSPQARKAIDAAIQLADEFVLKES